MAKQKPIAYEDNGGYLVCSDCHKIPDKETFVWQGKIVRKIYPEDVMGSEYCVWCDTEFRGDAPLSVETIEEIVANAGAWAMGSNLLN